jgi:hypothetical protein
MPTVACGMPTVACGMPTVACGMATVGRPDVDDDLVFYRVVGHNDG